MKPSIQSVRRSDSGGRGTSRVREPAGGRGNNDKSKTERGKSQTTKIVGTSVSSTTVENQVVIAKPFESESNVNNEVGEAFVKSSWGSGPSFAERIKLLESAKVKAILEDKKMVLCYFTSYFLFNIFFHCSLKTTKKFC